MEIIKNVVVYLENDQLNNSNIDNYTATYFHAMKVPEISMYSYLMRLQSYFTISDSCLISSVIYIDRLRPILNKHTIHRLFLASVLVSSKYLEDKPFLNSDCAIVGGIHVSELNILESQLLQLLNYNLYITESEFLEYLNKLS